MKSSVASPRAIIITIASHAFMMMHYVRHSTKSRLRNYAILAVVTILLLFIIGYSS
jgi:hypothetical protein